MTDLERVRARHKSPQTLSVQAQARKGTGPASVVGGQIHWVWLSEVAGSEADGIESSSLLEHLPCCLHPEETSGLLASLCTSMGGDES